MYLCLDLSSKATGWAKFNNGGALLEKGRIMPDPKIDPYNKIHFVTTHVKELFSNVNELIIEDIFLGSFRGKYNVNTLKYLARLSGAILYEWIINKYKIPHFYMASHARKLAGINGHCFDERTELLTKRGFLFIEELKNNDECLTMNKITEKLEWNKINEIFKYQVYNEDMCHFKSSGIDLLVDKKHGIIWKHNKNSHTLYTEAMDFTKYEAYSRKFFKVSGFFQKDNEEYPIEDNLLRLYAWILSEGSLYKGKTMNLPYTDIIQSKKEGIKRIKQLLKSLKIEKYVTITKVDMKYHSLSKLQPYRFRFKKIARELIFRFIDINFKNNIPIWFWKLSNRQFNLFLNEFILGDGTDYTLKHYKKIKQIHTKSLYNSCKSWIDAFQIRLFTSGKKSTVYWRKGGFKNNLYCMINFYPTEWKSIEPIKMNFKKYTGTKWCVNVNNGTVVVRRNGKMCITQNSHKAEIQLIILSKYGFTGKKAIKSYQESIDEFKAQYKAKKLKKGAFKYRMDKISKEIDKNTGISEDMADAVVLGLAYYNEKLKG